MDDPNSVQKKIDEAASALPADVSPPQTPPSSEPPPTPPDTTPIPSQPITQENSEPISYIIPPEQNPALPINNIPEATPTIPSIPTTPPPPTEQPPQTPGIPTTSPDVPIQKLPDIPAPDIPSDPIVPSPAQSTPEPPVVEATPPSTDPTLGINQQEATVIPPPPPKEEPIPKQTKKGPRAAIVALILILLISLPVGFYYVNQRTKFIANIVSRATGSVYCVLESPIPPDCTQSDCDGINTEAACGAVGCCKWVGNKPDDTCEGNGYKCEPGSYDCNPPTTYNYSCNSNQQCVEKTAVCTEPPPECDAVGTQKNCGDLDCCSGLEMKPIANHECKCEYIASCDREGTVNKCNELICCSGLTQTNLGNNQCRCDKKTTTSPSPTAGLGGPSCPGSPPPIGTKCKNTDSSYQGMCVIYHCPYGCGSGGCDVGDSGVWWEFKSCSSASLGATECGQIDIVDSNNVYCNPTSGCDVTALRCTDSCSGGPTQPPQPSNTVKPSSTATPKPTNTLAPSMTPKPSNTPSPSSTPIPSSTSAPSNTPIPTNTPIPPANCNASCTNTSCSNGLTCINDVCRNPNCTDESDCTCPPAPTNTPKPTATTKPTATKTPTGTIKPTATSIPLIQTDVESTPTPTLPPTPKIPVSGTGPSLMGMVTIAGAIFLLLLGLAL